MIEVMRLGEELKKKENRTRKKIDILKRILKLLYLVE